MAPSTPIEELLRRWRECRSRGETPTVEDLCRDSPGLAEEFRRRLLELEAATQEFQTALTGLRPGDEAAPEPPALRPGDEPLPGFRLEKRLGRGGFGEVWQATAPGGFAVALKFVPLARAAGAAEQQALEIVRHVRHVHLLTLFGAWQTGGLLVIAMELADGSLLQRLDEAVGRGLAGLPRGELLRHAHAAAAALDYLNKPRHFLAGHARPVGIQHGDVKPHNLLLVGSGLKVADFGLARVLTGRAGPGGFTPAYAPPEAFAGELSRASDQFALAVTYCQLRGGRLPYRDCGQASGEPPDLTMLPAAEWSVVGRALDADPRRRWPTCRAFVKALAEARAESELRQDHPPPRFRRETPDRTGRHTPPARRTPGQCGRVPR